MDCSVLLIHFIIGKCLLMVFTTYGNFHFVASLLSALLICVVSFSSDPEEGQWHKEMGKGLSMAFEQN